MYCPNHIVIYVSPHNIFILYFTLFIISVPISLKLSNTYLTARLNHVFFYFRPIRSQLCNIYLRLGEHSCFTRRPYARSDKFAKVHDIFSIYTAPTAPKDLTPVDSTSPHHFGFDFRFRRRGTHRPTAHRWFAFVSSLAIHNLGLSAARCTARQAAASDNRGYVNLTLQSESSHFFRACM